MVPIKLWVVYFSNLSFPCPREAPNEIWATLAQRLQRSHLKFSTFFPYKCIGKQRISPYKDQMSMYNHYFSNFGRPPSPIRHPWFWRRIFLKVFIIYGHGGHLVQRTSTILAIFHFSAPGRLQMKFEQRWPLGSRGEVIWNSQHFSHTNA